MAEARAKNILLRVAYDGSGFHGWQRQPRGRTAQGVLEKALSRVLGEPVQVCGTSRTDAGVHALGQCATLRGEFGIPTERIPVAANNLLYDLKVLSAEERQDGFHARFDAAGKKYVYRFAFPREGGGGIFLRKYAWLLETPLNTDIMRQAAKHLEGTHDFAAFQAAGGTPRETTVRTVFSVNVRETVQADPAGGEFPGAEIEIAGDGFLYNMVRIIAGTLAKVGAGRMAPEEMTDIIASKDRAKAGATAPPQGLYLKQVFFDDLKQADLEKARSEGDERTA